MDDFISPERMGIPPGHSVIGVTLFNTVGHTTTGKDINAGNPRVMGSVNAYWRLYEHESEE